MLSGDRDLVALSSQHKRSRQASNSRTIATASVTQLFKGTYPTTTTDPILTVRYDQMNPAKDTALCPIVSEGTGSGRIPSATIASRHRQKNFKCLLVDDQKPNFQCRKRKLNGKRRPIAPVHHLKAARQRTSRTYLPRGSHPLNRIMAIRDCRRRWERIQPILPQYKPKSKQPKLLLYHPIL